ncbi:response regulator transcription factor [Spirosoma endbachense]|uniref:HTH luxR-type domain-containing protein n=1 Tax=Spirosoma endbachense TaxID=2666025 RepID=A0A6P1W2Q1_9BACT|nr:helix-turn-helix transcriptional regulator [Spirosoma endbachense]QHV97966.1 hypothetical protein GJR95_24450 [Spirosoma endbachense]
MKPIRNLDNSALWALKTALDGLQRFHSDEQTSAYFKRIVDALVGPIDSLNVWAIRDQINEEDQRRSRRIAVKVADLNAYHGVERLGEQELRVLKLIGEGHHTKDIANLLSINVRTVANHKNHITAKLGLSTAKDLVKFAVNHLHFL